MNDQISRQKLIEDISKLPILITEDDDFVFLDAVLYVINSQPPADSGTDICVGTNQWIPCSSGRLPKHKQQAFITVKLTESRRYVTTANYYTETGIVDECEWADEGFYTYDSEYGYYRHENVIAWMPAEPYKGVE